MELSEPILDKIDKLKLKLKLSSRIKVLERALDMIFEISEYIEGDEYVIINRDCE